MNYLSRRNIIRGAFLLLFWIMALTSAMAEPFRTNDEASKWVQYYYMNPEPSRLPDFVQHIIKLRMANSKTEAHGIAGFLSGIFRNDPDKISLRMEQTSALQQPEHIRVVILGLWYAALPESQEMAQALLEKHPDLKPEFRFVYTEPPTKAGQEIPLEQALFVQDALWGQFSATGDKAPVERVISMLPMLDLGQRIKGYPNAHRSVAMFAYVSLMAHAWKHERVLKICEETAKTESPDVAMKLNEVVAKAKQSLKSGQPPF
jgi:hypothetical protein